MVHGEAVADQGCEAVANQGGDSSAAPVCLSEEVLMKFKRSMNRTSGNDADDEASNSRSGYDTADSRDYTNGSTAPGLPLVSEDDSLEKLLQPEDLTQ